jgi:hypothetical protein
MEERDEEYQAPEVFDIGAAEELTFGKNDGTWLDSLNGWTFEW